MKTVHRSILKELLYTFLLALVSLNFVLMTEKLLGLTKLLASVGSSISDMALITMYLQPQITVLTTPMAFLLAILLTYGRLTADSELVVMRTCGMSFREISRPVFMLGTGCFLAGIVLSMVIAPASSRKLKEFVSRAIASRAPYAIEEGIFNNTFRDIVIFVRKKPDRDTLEGIFIYDGRNERRPTAMFSGSGRIAKTDGEDISLLLDDGNIHIVRGENVTEVSFKRYNLTVPIAVSTPSKRYHELPPGRLLEEYRTGNPDDRPKMILEFHRRMTLPAVCIVLMFFGPPLSLRAGKTGRLGGLSMGLIVFAGYYAALMYMESLVRTARLPHYVGAWVPVLVLGTLAFYTFRKVDRA